MPRILRNYLISFAIIGLILLIVHLLDQYFHQQSATGRHSVGRHSASSEPSTSEPSK